MFKEIQAQLFEMWKRDQDMRKQMPEVLTDEQATHFIAVDAQNTVELKGIILEIGWPTISKVGKEAAEHAWLIAQHADDDPVFQKECLRLMRGQSDSEVSQIDLAYLSDRIDVNEGKPQFFGTQFTTIAGVYGPKPIADSEFVDDRRKALGMNSLVQYEKELREKYGIK